MDNETSHILEGIALAQERWPEASVLAFETDEPDSFVTGLSELLNVDRLQAIAIADMQVRRLGRLERDVVHRRLAEIRKQLEQAS